MGSVASSEVGVQAAAVQNTCRVELGFQTLVNLHDDRT
jgi:hypothetical protein